MKQNQFKASLHQAAEFALQRSSVTVTCVGLDTYTLKRQQRIDVGYTSLLERLTVKALIRSHTSHIVQLTPNLPVEDAAD